MGHNNVWELLAEFRMGILKMFKIRPRLKIRTINFVRAEIRDGIDHKKIPLRSAYK